MAMVQKTVYMPKNSKLDVIDPVLCSNKGSIDKVNVLETLKTKLGKFMIENLKIFTMI